MAKGRAKPKPPPPPAPTTGIGLQTRSRNKEMHPGMPDVPAPRRPTGEVQQEKASRLAADLEADQQQVENIKRVAAIEAATHQKEQERAARAPRQSQRLKLLPPRVAHKRTISELTVEEEETGDNLLEPIGQNEEHDGKR